MRRCIPVLAVITALVSASLPAAEHGGKIEVVGPDIVDFGKYSAWEMKLAQYTFRNSGDGILKIIQVRKACACATATVDKVEIQPGDTGTVAVTILPDSIFGEYKEATFVESSDPNTRFLRLPDVTSMVILRGAIELKILSEQSRCYQSERGLLKATLGFLESCCWP